MDIQTNYIYIRNITKLSQRHQKTKSRNDNVLTSLQLVVLTSFGAYKQLHWWAVLMYFGRPNARH